MAEYRRHAFEKDWHDKVEKFIEENDLAFDSPKYFIKFCVNRYMELYDDRTAEESEKYREAYERFAKLVEEKSKELNSNE